MAIQLSRYAIHIPSNFTYEIKEKRHRRQACSYVVETGGVTKPWA